MEGNVSKLKENQGKAQNFVVRVSKFEGHPKYKLSTTLEKFTKDACLY